MIKGSCLCGGVKFEIDGSVVMSRYCHCENCRKFSGTAQAAWGLANTTEFRQTTADAHETKFDAGSGSTRTFCASCGSPLWFEPKDMPAFMGIALGAIDEGDVEPPGFHLWVRSSPDWETIEGTLPQHETIPESR
ncbi:MAG: hypothetical protein ACI9ON_002355 [Limisphaerales bacterium]|jgi:hypothetical protein